MPCSMCDCTRPRCRAAAQHHGWLAAPTVKTAYVPLASQQHAANVTSRSPTGFGCIEAVAYRCALKKTPTTAKRIQLRPRICRPQFIGSQNLVDTLDDLRSVFLRLRRISYFHTGMEHIPKVIRGLTTHVRQRVCQFFQLCIDFRRRDDLLSCTYADVAPVRLVPRLCADCITRSHVKAKDTARREVRAK